MLENKKLVPLPPNDPLPIWSQNKTTFKGSYWTTDKNMFNIDETKILEREDLYLKNDYVSKVEWWRHFTAAVCMTQELQARH